MIPVSVGYPLYETIAKNIRLVPRHHQAGLGDGMPWESPPYETQNFSTLQSNQLLCESPAGSLVVPATLVAAKRFNLSVIKIMDSIGLLQRNASGTNPVKRFVNG